MSDEVVMEALAVVGSFDRPAPYAAIGSVLCGRGPDRSRQVGLLRCRPLLEMGLAVTGPRGRVSLTERGRIALALVLVRQPLLETGLFDDHEPCQLADRT